MGTSILPRLCWLDTTGTPVGSWGQLFFCVHITMQLRGRRSEPWKKLPQEGGLCCPLVWTRAIWICQARQPIFSKYIACWRDADQWTARPVRKGKQAVATPHRSSLASQIRERANTRRSPCNPLK